MRSLGRLSAIVLLQLIFVGILLYFIGRLPQRELGLLWHVVWTGESPLDAPPAPPPAPEEEASYADLLRARMNEEREIARKRRELESLASAAQSRVEVAAAAEKELRALEKKLEKDVQDKKEQAVASGKQTLVTLLETAPPKVAKSFLLDQARTDEGLVVEILKRLDPVVAAKVFKEFKQPADLGKLNDWLAKVGQGEPEAGEIRELERERESLSKEPSTTPPRVAP